MLLVFLTGASIAMVAGVLRFNGLKAKNIVKNRVQLDRMQRLYGFPKGRLLSPNVRAWTEDEIDTWLDDRPVENTAPLKGAILKRQQASMAKAREALPASRRRKAKAKTEECEIV